MGPASAKTWEQALYERVKLFLASMLEACSGYTQSTPSQQPTCSIPPLSNNSSALNSTPCHHMLCTHDFCVTLECLHRMHSQIRLDGLEHRTPRRLHDKSSLQHPRTRIEASHQDSKSRPQTSAPEIHKSTVPREKAVPPVPDHHSEQYGTIMLAPPFCTSCPSRQQPKFPNNRSNHKLCLLHFSSCTFKMG